MTKSKTLVFATGTPDPKRGGSGAEKLVLASRDGRLDTEIVGFVSNHEHGGVRTLAIKHKVPFVYFPGPWTADKYQGIADVLEADYFALSGWLKLVEGLDPNTRFNSRTVFNIHPGLLPNCGGSGWYGHYVHERVIAAYKRGWISHSGLTMHFVDEKYDHGPTFFKCLVPIDDMDTPDSIGAKVNAQEHIHQSIITNLVVTGQIAWDGVHPESLVVPTGYSITRFA